MRNQTVLISGASIAGPALAYWLHRYGFAVTVVERAPALRPGGQAVDFKGRTHLTVLERMGILDAVRARRTGTTDLAFVDDDGRELAQLSGDFTGGDIEILRGDLAEILYARTADTVDYVFGDTVTALTDTESGVRVEFERGPSRTFDLVIGADGIHSRVRRLAFGPESDYVHHLGHYYCVAGTSRWADAALPRERARGYAHNTPGKLAVDGGSKAQQMYLFASPTLEYDRDDIDAARRVITTTYADTGWHVPRMLADLAEFDEVYLDSISQVRMDGAYTRGRVALVGDSAYGNTLAGFGTGLAVVGAYVLAGELACAAGDHVAAFDAYERIMRRYAKIAGNSNTGRFLAPKTALGIKARNWFLGSPLFTLMLKYGDKAANDIDLIDYPSLVAATASHP
ncbi:FAD-dependent oxidoreductase [Nocardia asteroides NBRC 15531]|uniref:Oxidoreductase n=1 Tax=Nocardia asteroides NBRC 15531 TaxID=1110697 RepID=U5E8C0_NOCAS|nr:FAD-dependent monooxygenase [Nocardia asteroides]TLF69988.1 FAD-dependent oxidoreductase [Nocardia asteroides NBRC 15531]UGT49508.1 FAD-dependent monooxygenase [Nocardia asteroides]SFL92875.1 2-polyprenyl-6-methoxyphenol hydroxylase [Nocardia asteroides]VEG37885.1 6-hydroxynicotinate 3-monooxygenase precursor [Nocardia asteroides]GAD82708.1 putative oxidoreductase [Nocardia asteroides NBRC 15531]